MNRSVDLVLIGGDRQDNLALGYLTAAAERAGYTVAIAQFNVPADADAAIDVVNACDPALVGVSIPFQTGIRTALELISRLRASGYSGHLTCGGHVPTFCYHELLCDSPHIDSVIRHEGELTVVELLDRLTQGGENPLAGIRGLVWRGNDEVVVESPRPLVSDLASVAPPRRASRPFSIGGIPIAFLIGSRGCTGECVYCSIRAFGRDAGGPQFRMRPVDDIADEVEEIHDKTGGRIFFFQDDLFIMPREDVTVDRIHALSKALGQRGIRDSFFWIKGRPNTITKPICEAARELGVLHLFLGVESASARQLRYLGRTHSPADNKRAIALCHEHGMVPSFNLMLFDPDSTLDDVASNLDFAAEHLELPWNICRTEIYPGTRLKDLLEAQRRLEGDYSSYGYTMLDPRAEIMFRVMRVSFHERAFACDSLLNRLISLTFAGQVHEALLSNRRSKALWKIVRSLSIDVHRDTVDRMRRYLDFASTTSLTNVREIRDFAIEDSFEVNALNARWLGQFDELWRTMSIRGIAHRSGAAAYPPA